MFYNEIGLFDHHEAAVNDSDGLLDSFSTFGDLLRYFRLRAQLTQKELAISVGYSEAQISRLEKNRRPPALSMLTAMMIPALCLEKDPGAVIRLLDLARQAREKTPVQAAKPVQESEVDSRTNLPVQLTSFIGRETELETVRALLAKPATRLVTLTGVGGCGKTRLAQKAGEELLQGYPHGVWLVRLGSISEPGLIQHAVISALGLLLKSTQPQEVALIRFLKNRRLLLILDNCEHLVNACEALVETLLQSCLYLKILATSREPLGVPGEVTLRVPSLSLPSADPTSMEELGESEAVQLFIERAQQALPVFTVQEEDRPALARICRHLDGIPLAIELAAARARLLSIDQIDGRLGQNFILLANPNRSAIPRHRTLRAAIDWSYALLSEPEKILLRRLSIFSGGWTLNDAEAVCSGGELDRQEILNLLGALVDKSLVAVSLETPHQTRQKYRGDPTYHLLVVINQYAREKLVEAGEEIEIQRRFMTYYLEMAASLAQGLHGANQVHWLHWVRGNRNNLNAAFSQAVANKNVEAALRLSSAMLPYWNIEFDLEGMRWIETALQMASNSMLKRTVWYARTLYGLGWFEFYIGKEEEWQKHVKESLDLFSLLEDAQGMATCSNFLSFTNPDLKQACKLAEQTLSFLEGTPYQWETAAAYFYLATAENGSGEIALARDHLNHCQKLFQILGDRFFQMEMQTLVCWFYFRQGEIKQSRSILEANLAFNVDLDIKRYIIITLVILQHFYGVQGEYKLACSTLQQGLQFIQNHMSWWDNLSRQFLSHMGLIKFWQGDLKTARMLVETATGGIDITELSKTKMLNPIGWIEHMEGNYDRAGDVFECYLAADRENHNEDGIPFDLEGIGFVALARGDPKKAESLFLQALALHQKHWTIPYILNSLYLLGRSALQLGDPARAARISGAERIYRERTGLPLYAVYRQIYNQYLEHLREALAPEQFLTAWADGERMSIEDAVAYALEGSQTSC